MVKKGDIIKIILVVIALIFCFLLIYNLHIAYPYEFINPNNSTLVEFNKYPFPLHNDEWAHISLGLAIAEEGRYNFNPAIGEQTQDISLFSILFFASIKSNLNILGNWFFTPLTFSLFLIFIYLYFFTKAIGSTANIDLKTRKKKVKNKNKMSHYLHSILNKNTWLFSLSILFFLILIFIYPLAAELAALISFFYVIINIKFIKKKWKQLSFFGILAIIIVLIGVKMYFWTGSLTGSYQKFLSELIFKKGWTILEHTYSLIGFYGIIPLLLATAGCAYLFIKKKNMLFFIWPALLLINMIIFILFDISLFFPYQRNLFYFLIGLAPLSAMGLYWLSELIINYSKKFIFKKKIHGKILCIIIIFVLLSFTFNNYYKIEPAKFSLHNIISEAEYESLLWLKEHYEPYNKVIAKPFFAVSVYPISQNRVLGMMPSSLEGGHYAKVFDFYNGKCDYKEKVVREEIIDFVISDEPIRCDFLGKIYYKDGVTIYKVLR